MGWPINRDSFEDDLFFEFTPQELGIESKAAAKIQEIKRLRPLVPDQPWGVFFIRFEPKRLPVVALRRILSQVALRKRASANNAERKAWAADDLLFISSYGEGDGRQISFAQFSQDESKQNLPTLKVLGWDNLDTPLHLDAVAEKLTRNLAWPDDTRDVEAWRQRWRSAFTLQHRQIIETSKELSIRLAELARNIRDRIKTALTIEIESGPLRRLMNAFKEALVHDLDAEGFADMYAQTISYGLLSARITDPSSRTTDNFAAHMRTNPFLKELMETFLHVGGRHQKAGGPGIDFDELGVSEVVELLDDTDMGAVLQDFGDKNPQEDPIIHFYELFLKQYDTKKRMQRGVFYTPRPVVSYIVRTLDEILRSEFNLADGLADTTTWGEMAKRHKELTIPQGVEPSQAFVQILDPATGTGTFLVEAIELIHLRMLNRWRAQGHRDHKLDALWNEYVPKHLLPRLHGFELLMAPYAIAHLKVGLKLYETGYRFASDERLQIYLTNALEPAHDFSGRFDFAIPALAHEAHAVSHVKQTMRFTVFMGNPPYNNRSENKTPWIMNLIEVYKSTVRREETQIQALSDDYVKFFRLGDWSVSQSGVGILGVITNNGYLDGHIFRDMRRHLVTEYPVVSILNLHGDARKKEHAPDGQPDKNVFDIMQGVCITIAARTREKPNNRIHVADLWGSRETKYETLLSVKPNISWETLGIDDAIGALRAKHEKPKEWDEAERLVRCFGTGDWSIDKTSAYGSGFKSQQDEFAIAFSREEFISHVQALLEPRMTEKALREQFALCNTSQWSFLRARERLRKMDWRNLIQKVLFRPFDYRFTALIGDIVTNPRRNIMAQMERPNLALLATRKATEGFAVFVTKIPCGHKIVGNYDMTTVFPIYHYSELEEPNGRTSLGYDSKTVNFSNSFLTKLGEITGFDVRNSPGGTTANRVSPESILYYIYAIFHSLGYRARYAKMLSHDYPRIPLSANSDLFLNLVRLGRELVDLHTMESSRLGENLVKFVGRENPVVQSVSFDDGTVWINKDKSCGFRGVDQMVWDHQIGAYFICQKWLKDRVERVLVKEDVEHYRRVIAALSATSQFVSEIDATISDHGGWPGAFAGFGAS